MLSNQQVLLTNKVVNSFPRSLLKMKNSFITTDEANSEDLKAFERRLIEIMNCTKPKMYMWRIIFALVFMFTGIGAWWWVSDPQSAEIAFLDSVWKHPLFFISVITLIYLFAVGAHRKVMYSDIMADRTQEILEQYNMTCDKKGQLIMVPQFGTNKYN